MPRTTIRVKRVEGADYLRKHDLLDWMEKIVKSYPNLPGWTMYKSLKEALHDSDTS